MSVVNSSIETLDASVSDLDNAVTTIEEEYVQDVDASTDTDDIIVRNAYIENNTTNSSVVVQDGIVTYTITKTVNGVDQDVTTINTVDPLVIEKIAEILAGDASKLNEVEKKLSWINL